MKKIVQNLNSGELKQVELYAMNDEKYSDLPTTNASSPMKCFFWFFFRAVPKTGLETHTNYFISEAEGQLLSSDKLIILSFALKHLSLVTVVKLREIITWFCCLT